MFKKITGVSEETIREHIRQARADYKAIFKTVEQTKQLYYKLQQ